MSKARRVTFAKKDPTPRPLENPAQILRVITHGGLHPMHVRSETGTLGGRVAHHGHLNICQISLPPVQVSAPAGCAAVATVGTPMPPSVRRRRRCSMAAAVFVTIRIVTAAESTAAAAATNDVRRRRYWISCSRHHRRGCRCRSPSCSFRHDHRHLSHGRHRHHFCPVRPYLPAGPCCPNHPWHLLSAMRSQPR